MSHVRCLLLRLTFAATAQRSAVAQLEVVRRFRAPSIMNISELIGHWRLRVHRMQIAHYDSEAYFGRLHLYLGLPVIALSTIVGTSVFASLQESTQKDSRLQITIGLLSVAAAVLSGLQTFLGYAERAEKQRAQKPEIIRFGARLRKV